MELPEGKTEREVLEAIERAVGALSPSFVFGAYGLDDIKQQARLFALEALPRYDPQRPLFNFLCKHVRNRLINLKRDKHRRNDPPCLPCHHGSPCEGRAYCKKYEAWLHRNNAKANLSRPVGLDSVSEERGRESTVHQDAELSEMLRLIDEKLPVSLRADYLRMREGVSVSRARRDAVTEAVRGIIGEA